MIDCPKCSELNGNNATRCFRCGTDLSALRPVEMLPVEDEKKPTNRYLLLCYTIAAFLWFGLAVGTHATFFAFLLFVVFIALLIRCVRAFRLYRNSLYMPPTPPPGTPSAEQLQKTYQQQSSQVTPPAQTIVAASPVALPTPHSTSLSTSVPSTSSSKLSPMSFLQRYSVHPDLDGLLYTSADTDCPFNEPSRIGLFLPIAEDEAGIEPLFYYPAYEKMSPRQRLRYLRFLANPYNPDIDIGYVFVLYYGLERHLLERTYTQRVLVIIQKLFQAHNQASFRNYASNALIYFCSRNDCLPALAIRVYDHADALPLVYLAAKCSHALTSTIIIDCAKAWGFENQRYIKMHPDLFKETLESLLTERYGVPALPVQDFDDYSMPTGLFPVYANYSLPARECALPNLFEYKPVASACHEALVNTHETVKKILAERRKKST